MENKKVLGSLMSFALTILIFSATIFAWITLSEQASIDDFVLNVNELKSDIELKIKKNNGDFVDIKNQEDFNALITNALPSDTYLFNLVITNKSTRSSSIKIALYDIDYINVNNDYDMRNVFYLQDGLISLNGALQQFLEPITEEPGEVHNQELNLFNLNNLIVNRSIVLLDNYFLEIDQELMVEFTIVYDQNTSAKEYQDGKLSISAIYIYNS